MTVVVIVLIGGDLLRRCLQALAAQREASALQVIVPYDDAHSDVGRLAEEFSGVRFVYVEGRHTYAQLRSVGVGKATSDVIALLEDHCVPDPHWAREIVRAHKGAVMAVGGPVDKLTPDTALNWSLYLADYVRYARPLPAGPVEHLTDCNVSYKRSDLDAIADVWTREFHEPEVHAALQERGGTLWFDPGVLVHQQRPISLAEAVKDRYAFGRLFGSRRVEGQPIGVRAKMAAMGLLLPPLLVARVGRIVFSKKRYRGDFLRALPYVVLMNTLWATGEVVGYITARSAASLAPSEQKVDARSAPAGQTR